MPHVLIIGGGVSGLSAGIHALMRGYTVTLCEKHIIPGGNLTGWQRGSYHIDNCIHWLTGTNPSTKAYKTWVDLGALGDVDVVMPPTLYTCELDGEELSLYLDLAKTEKQMLSLKNLTKRDKREIKTFISTVRAFSRITDTGVNPMRGVAKIGTAISAISLIKYYRLTVNELAERFDHPLIRLFIGSFWGKDFGALGIINVFATYTAKNGGIPRGGSRAMAERMANRFLSLGGKLLLNKEAVKINHDGKTASAAVFSDGEVIEADYVVITYDPAHALKVLLDLSPTGKLARLYQRAGMKRFSSSHCAFSCDTASLAFHGDFICEVPKKHEMLLGTDKLFLREFSHEPLFAPEGKTVVEALIFCNEQHARKFIELKEKKPRAYKRIKQRIESVVRSIISEKLPSLNGKLSHIDTWTPATYKRYTGADVGSYMSFIMPAKFIPIPMKPRATRIKNLLLATQWQQPPGGLPIAAQMGKQAIDVIHRLERKKRTQRVSAVKS